MNTIRSGREAAKAVMILGVLALFGTASICSAEGDGTTAAPFLKIGTSARAEGMGGAFTAVANDVDANYWNPAGLSQLKRSTVGFTHLEWFEGIRYETLTYADKYDYIGAVGVSIGYLFLGNIPKTLETASGDYDSINSGGTFGASDLAVGLAWAGNLFLRENKIGIGVKMIQEQIDTSSSFGLAVDLGDQFLFSKTRWYHKALEEGNWAMNLVPGTLAVAVRNIGTPVKYATQNDPLPMIAQVGLAYQFFDDDLTAAVDYEYRMAEATAVLRAGAEYWLRTGVRGSADQTLDFALRAGWRNGYDASSAPGISFGGGVQYSAVGLDYVFMPFGDLGVTHRISLKYSWGDILKDKTAVKRRHIVKKALSPSEMALQETANEMMKNKKTMEEKVVVKKAPTTKKSLTEIEAKKPEDEGVAKETQGAGGDLTEPAEPAAPSTNAAPAPTAPVTAPKSPLLQTSTKAESNALIAQIAKSAKGAGAAAAAARTQSQYLRRTSDDAIRAARREAENKSLAFDEVETAAQAEAKQSGEAQVTKTTVYFAKDSDSLNDKYLFAIDQIAASFDKGPQRTILVHGYASADEKDSNALSIRRAKAVKDYLVQIKSISGGRVSLKGFGDKDPAADNGSEKGRARNRRVRVQIIQAGN